jgi:Mg-chelatase subunit ChlD
LLPQKTAMGVIVFVVDTSGSMNQRASSGVSLLDLAKGAVAQLVRLRRRDGKNDRFLLVTFADNKTTSIKVRFFVGSWCATCPR